MNRAGRGEPKGQRERQLHMLRSLSPDGWWQWPQTWLLMKRQYGFTIFDVFSLCGTVVGAIVGGSYGFEHFGSVGAVVAAVMGGYVGLLLGRVPLALGLWWMQRCEVRWLHRTSGTNKSAIQRSEQLSMRGDNLAFNPTAGTANEGI